MSPSSYANTRNAARRSFVNPMRIPLHRRVLVTLRRLSSSRRRLYSILLLLVCVYYLATRSTGTALSSTATATKGTTKARNLPSTPTPSSSNSLRFAPTQIQSSSATIHFENGMAQEVFTPSAPRTTRSIERFVKLWQEGDVAAVRLPIGGSLSFVQGDDEMRREVLQRNMTCERGECRGMTDLRYDQDILLALRQMKSSALSDYIVFRRPSLEEYDKSAVTLVTQFTLSRLQRFERTLREWDGPISVTIYLTDAADIDTLEEYLIRKGSIFDKLALTVVKPDYSLNEGVLTERLRYPINRLRNLALELAPTLYVLVTDADFVPSPNMHQLLSTRGVRLINSSTNSPASRSPTLIRTAIVVSAFVLASSFSGSYPSTPSELAALLNAHPPLASLTDVNSGHGPSLPSLLFEPSSAPLVSPFTSIPSLWAYTACFEPQWEPYYLLHRPSHPLYDERFTDQGGDKQSHTLLLNALGYEFKVLRDVWFMHPPKGSAHESEELEKWPSARLVDPDVEGRIEDPAHFSIAQLDKRRFRYFEDFLPEMEGRYGWNLRWPRGCSARVVGERSFGRARAGTIFGM